MSLIWSLQIILSTNKNVKVTKNKLKPQQLAIHVYHSRFANSHNSALSLMFFLSFITTS